MQPENHLKTLHLCNELCNPEALTHSPQPTDWGLETGVSTYIYIANILEQVPVFSPIDPKQKHGRSTISIWPELIDLATCQCVVSRVCVCVALILLSMLGRSIFVIVAFAGNYSFLYSLFDDSLFSILLKSITGSP